MRTESRNWFVSAALAGAMMAAPAAFVYGKVKSGTQSARQQIHEDQQKLRSDARQYGKKSPQAKADRRQLRKDENRLREAMENAGRVHRSRNRYPF